MLDTLGTRYHVLPSEALDKASSFDMYVLGSAIEYYRRQRNKEKGISALPTPEWSEAEMEEMALEAEEVQRERNKI